MLTLEFQCIPVMRFYVLMITLCLIAKESNKVLQSFSKFRIVVSIEFSPRLKRVPDWDAISRAEGQSSTQNIGKFKSFSMDNALPQIGASNLVDFTMF